jgi:hypothetical protein
MYGGNLWGAQRGGKKSSKQRFAERQVCSLRLSLWCV